MFTLHKKWRFPLRISLVTFTEEILNWKLHFLCSVTLPVYWCLGVPLEKGSMPYPHNFCFEFLHAQHEFWFFVVIHLQVLIPVAFVDICVILSLTMYEYELCWPKNLLRQCLYWMQSETDEQYLQFLCWTILWINCHGLLTVW